MSDTQKHTKPNVPNLRFPGFSGEWKQYTMGEITELFSRRNKNKVDYPMFSVTNARGFVNQQEQFEDREMKGEDIAAYKIVSPGEFAYNPARINVGSIARYDGGTDCMISSLYVCFKAKKELVDSQLLLHILKSPKMVYKYGINGEGGVRIYLFYPNFARIRVKLPSIEEQRRIASFLDLIEEKIQIQNKVIEKYESLIKALYSRLLPLEVDKTAELGTLVQICKGKQLNGEFLSDDGKYYVMNGGITPSGYYDEYNTPAETISISEGGNSCGFVQYNEKPFWSGGHCYTLLQTTDERIQYKFLYHFLKSKQDEIMALRIGSGLPNIQKKDIERFPVPILPIDYQNTITRLLDAIGKFIENEQAILVELTCQKISILGNLFI